MALIIRFLPKKFCTSFTTFSFQFEIPVLYFIRLDGAGVFLALGKTEKSGYLRLLKLRTRNRWKTAGPKTLQPCRSLG